MNKRKIHATFYAMGHRLMTLETHDRNSRLVGETLLALLTVDGHEVVTVEFTYQGDPC